MQTYDFSLIFDCESDGEIERVVITDISGLQADVRKVVAEVKSQQVTTFKRLTYFHQPLETSPENTQRS